MNSLKKKPIYRSLRSIEKIIEVRTRHFKIKLRFPNFSEIKIENDELKDKNTEIPELRRKFAETEAERAELKGKVTELPKQGVEESKRRDAENAKLKTKIKDSPNFNLVADHIPMATHHEKPLVDTSLPEKLIPEGYQRYCIVKPIQK
uniref:Uncharacterized protein n=1 Tax=Rhizophagus irregularis (strain DAOM 181602 / DAOM 197198 / MUCL 43194) TaxID=747089 RepID=U9UUP1_RHIID